MDRLYQLKMLLKRTLIELNLFKIYPSDVRQIRHQHVATWLYIVILLSTCVILTCYSCIISETYHEIVKYPTQSQFSNLLSLYPVSLQCPCSSISIPYNTFLNLEPQYHQVCSSDFVSTAWLAWLNEISSSTANYADFRNNGPAYFHILALLCKEAIKTVTNALQQFLQEKYITAQVVSQQVFASQIAAFISSWKVATMNNFLRPFQLISAIQQGNHLGATFSNVLFSITDSNEFQVDSVESLYKNCSCLLLRSCLAQMRIYHQPAGEDYYLILTPVVGLVAGCFQVEALLTSTLDCFYRKNCLDIMFHFVKMVVSDTRNITVTSLDPSLNDVSETIESLVKRLFVDSWYDSSSNNSFSAYYQACSPQSCAFQRTGRRSIITIIATIIGIFGGLTTGLKILLSVLLRVFAKVRSDRSFRSHFGSAKIWFFTLCNQERLASRLHTLLLLITLTALYLASSITLQTQTEQVAKPSFQIYEHLHLLYPATLQCSCSKISIKYQSFMNLTIIRQHQLCSSDFVSDQWITTLLLPNILSTYSPFEFRKVAIGHFQLLSLLCQLTQQHLSDAISDLVTKNFVESQLVLPTAFNMQIQAVIDRFQLATINSFLITLQVVRDMFNDNKLISIFETNWKWMNPEYSFESFFGAVIHTKPVVYGTCDCGLFPQCVQAGIVSNNLTIPGLMVGCYPLEALLQSTFECLYNTSCFHLLQTLNGSFTPLDASVPSRYKLNSSVEFILSQLMIEEWFSNISYENYYAECAPSSCSYSYLTHRPAVDVLTIILGLYGGLVIIMNVVVLILLALWKQIIDYRRLTRIQTINN
ncbi:hypothetical protein I4U23_025339 [Adineta vaga]|nr:hypothetical protein I4U23_025339 [Adineta vaga]